jgi:thioredoxin reductase (NADPH)
MLSGYGSRRPTSRGELLIVEGRPDEAFIVVLSGRVAIVKAFGTPEQQIVRVHGPGRFLGELGLLTGQVAFFTAIVLDPGEVLEVAHGPAARVPAAGSRVRGRDPARLPDPTHPGHRRGARLPHRRVPVLGRHPQAARVRGAQPAAAPVRGPGVRPDAESLLRALGITPAETPVVVWRDKVLRNPDPAELAALIGQRPPDPRPS